MYYSTGIVSQTMESEMSDMSRFKQFAVPTTQSVYTINWQDQPLQACNAPNGAKYMSGLRTFAWEGVWKESLL